MRDAVRILSYYCCRVEVVGRWVLQGLESCCSKMDIVWYGSRWLSGVVLSRLTLTAAATSSIRLTKGPFVLVLKQPHELLKA